LVSRAVGVPAEGAFATSGLYVLAPILGFIALAAPAGLGVREAALSIGLAASVGPAGAVVAAIVSRAGSLLIDVALWLLAKPLARSAD
jgi:uncharacterized membrane protein YbhN (UPF0104 family)